MQTPPGSTRRSFLAVTGSALLSASALPAQAPAGRPLRLGFIGCGGRGTFVAGIVKEDGGYTFAGAADYFQDRLDTFAAAFGVPAEKCYTGMDGYRKLLADPDIDAVAIHSPPYFHIGQMEAAIDAGKHVIVAKPVAIDVPGCARAKALAEKAAAKGLVIVVDVQCRGNATFQEAIGKVHAGAIGDFCFGECDYEADTIPQQSTGDGPEDRLRNWVHWKELGGDIITEQAIHAVDIVSWALGTPVQATGTSGRRVRTFAGNTADHYSVLFEFPTGAVNFLCRQYSAWGIPFTCANRIYGTKGVLLTDFTGRVMIRGNAGAYYAGAKMENLYKNGSVENVRAFREAVSTGKPDGNPTVAAAAETVLLTLLGQAAADQKTTVTREALLREGKAVTPDLSGLRA